jgi:hypothetical protein
MNNEQWTMNNGQWTMDNVEWWVILVKALLDLVNFSFHFEPFLVLRVTCSFVKKITMNQVIRSVAKCMLVLVSVLILVGCEAQQSPTPLELSKVTIDSLSQLLETERNFSQMLEKHLHATPVFTNLLVLKDTTDRIAQEEVILALDGKKEKKMDVLSFLGSRPYCTNETSFGIIDSSGKVIVPFIADKYRMTSDTSGELLFYTGKHSLPTGVPRSQFYFVKVPFNRNGMVLKKAERISIVNIDYGYDDLIPWPF